MIRRRLLTGTLSNFVGRFTTVGLWFVLTPFVLAQLGPGGYALWVLLGAVASYGSLLDFGIGGAVVKYVAEHVARGERDAARTLVASARWLYLGLAATMMALGILLAPVLPDLLGVETAERETARWLVILTGGYMALTIAFAPAVSVLRGLQRHDLFNGVQIMGSLLLATATVAVLLAGWGVVGMVAANIPVNIAMGLASTYLVGRTAPDLRLRWRGANLVTIRRIAGFSSSMFLIDIAGVMRTKSDGFVIARFLTLSAVTPYELARKLGEVTEMAAVQFLKVVMPLASELDAGQFGQKLRDLYIIGSRVALAVAVPTAVVLIILGGHILALWVGPEYAAQAPLVAILATASLIATSQSPAAKVLQGIARHRMVASTELAAAVANIALSMALLPLMGLPGVALGTLIPTAIASLGVVMPFANRTLHVSWRSALRKIWLPGILPGAGAAAVLLTLEHQSAPPSPGVLLLWVAAAFLVYGIGYLSMPACGAERGLVSDLLASVSQRLRQQRPAVSRRVG